MSKKSIDTHHQKQSFVTCITSSMIFATMSPANNNELQRIFNSLDQNGDGEVSIDELELLLERTGVPTSSDELLLLVGKDGLDFHEFSYFYDSLVSTSCSIKEDEDGDQESYLLEAFKVFDLNGDGLLSPEEIKDVLLRLGLWTDNGGMDCMRIVCAYDMNSDGFVDFEEFKRMMLVV